MSDPARSSALASSWLVLKASVKSFGANRDLQTAASLAYYGFLSLMPLLLIALIALGGMLNSSERAAQAIGGILSSALPSMSLNVLRDIGSLSSGGALSVVSFVLLIWSMTPLSAALRTALARMFAMMQPQAFLKAKLLDVCAVLSFLALFLVNATLRMYNPASAGLPPDATLILGFISHTFLPSALSILFLGLVFRTFSPVRLTWRQWLLGAVCVTVLGALMRHLFVMIIQYNPNYGYAFGSLKALFILIVWVYYSFAALLFGAEIMANTYRRDALLLKGLLEPGRALNQSENSMLRKFERILQDGEILFRENDSGNEMYVILDGEISIIHAGRELARLPAGRYFGEMSLLNEAPRTATAKAVGGARLAAITQNNFDLLVRENPTLVRGLLGELSKRLADTNKKVDGGR